jgi:hypothetical protein
VSASPAAAHTRAAKLIRRAALGSAFGIPQAYRQPRTDVRGARYIVRPGKRKVRTEVEHYHERGSGKS